MKRVLLFSHTTGYQLRAFNDAAERLGIELVFATDRCHVLDDPWQDRAVPVHFYDFAPSLNQIARRSRETPIHGILAVGDRPVVLAAYAAQALGLPWHSVAGAEASTDKRRSRAAFEAEGLPSPRFLTMDPRSRIGDQDSGFAIRGSAIQGSAIQGSAIRGSEIRDPGSAIRDQGFDYPVVLKPVGLSGSRGVIRANDDREFAAAVRRIGALLARPQIRAARAGLEDEILVEEYIPGDEYALEGLVSDGRLRVFALFGKPDPLVGPFFEETIYVTLPRTAAGIPSRIAAMVERGAWALGLTHGPVHAECRVTPQGEIYILEIAARPIGGLCSRVLSFVGPGDPDPVPLETVLLQHALGQSIDHYEREAAAAAVMMMPIPRRGIFKEMHGVAAAAAVPGITEIRITAKAGQLLEPLPEAGSYLGFIFARGVRPQDAEQSVRAAHAHLVPEIANSLTVVGQ